MTQKAAKHIVTPCSSCAIRERAVCAYCDTDELERLNAIKSYKTYSKGAEIVAAGERSPVVATIVHGVVALSKTLIDGRRQMVGLQFPSDFVGGAFQAKANCDAVAASEVLVCQFERNAFEAMLTDTPRLQERLLDMTMTELDAAREWLTLLGQKTAREKVASFLLLIIRRKVLPEKTKELQGELPITRAEMGEYLGLTIETVSRQLSKLKSAGLIDFETIRRFTVYDYDLLAAEAGEDS